MSAISVVLHIAKRLKESVSHDRGDLGRGFQFLLHEMESVEEIFKDEDTIISQDVERRACQLAYDIEDAVEFRIIRQLATSSSSCNNVIIKKIGVAMTSFCPPPPPESDIIVSKIRELKTLLLASGPRVSVQEHSSSRGQEPGMIIVGMGSYADRLLGELLEPGKPDLAVIPICGRGGIGKTTLARHVYNSDSVQRHFPNRAWARVDMESQPRNILETMLSCLLQGSSSSTTTTDKIAKLETMELMEELYKAQKGKRYLVVLDAVWSLKAWDALKFACPDDHNGSRVIITTRFMDLARYVAPTPTSVLEMLPLTESESWELLVDRSGQRRDSEDMLEIDPSIERIGQQIVTRLGGLPLTLTVIGKCLLGQSVKYWSEMLHELKKTPLTVADILTLSYHQLQSHQKACFLYLGQFPRDTIVSVDRLYLLWMAEGMILTGGRYGETQMEVVVGYLNDLVRRSLVFAEGNVEVSMSLPLGMHDLVHGICILHGKREGFYEYIDFCTRNMNSSSTRRLAVHLDMYSSSTQGTNYGDALSDITEPKHIKSILFFDKITIDDEDDHESVMPKPTQPRQVWADLTKFKWTRVLGFDGVDFRVKNLLIGIEKLIYLRYLSFYGCYLHVFPSFLISNPYYFLETLDLRVSVSCLMIIPNVLNKLSKLRHLYFPLEFSISCDKLKIEKLEMLELLENFHSGMCDSSDLLHLNNLRVFTGFVDGNNTDLENAVTCLNKNMGKRNLHHSSLVVKNFDTYSRKRRSIVAMTLESDSVYALDMVGHLGDQFPCRAEKIGSKLRDIVFNGSEFREDPMPILGKLPNLGSLVLCDDAFVGKEIVLCCGSDFPQLTILKLATLQYLERLEVKTQGGEDEMQLTPKLVRLTIEQCDKLETLPSQLGNITTLQVFMIGSMPQEFQNKVSTMVQEKQRGRNTETKVTFYD